MTLLASLLLQNLENVYSCLPHNCCGPLQVAILNTRTKSKKCSLSLHFSREMCRTSLSNLEGSHESDAVVADGHRTSKSLAGDSTGGRLLTTEYMKLLLVRINDDPHARH